MRLIRMPQITLKIYSAVILTNIAYVKIIQIFYTCLAKYKI